MVKTVSAEVELAVPVPQVWAALKDSSKLFPQIAPHFVSSVEVVEGKAGDIGSIRFIKFGSAAPEGAFVRERLLKLDNVEHIVSTEEVEGGHLAAGYTKYVSTTKLSSNESGTLISWSAEYELEGEPKFPIDLAKDGTVKLFKGLEEYLLASQAYL